MVLEVVLKSLSPMSGAVGFIINTEIAFHGFYFVGVGNTEKASLICIVALKWHQ